MTMLYVHGNNIRNKISTNYKGKGNEIYEFYKTVYLPMKPRVLALNFNSVASNDFKQATDEFNTYYNDLIEFSSQNNITSQSKFASTFLEEISCYIFKDLPEIRNETFGIFNKGIFAGIKINSNNHVGVIKKDVDFCIGKKVKISIDNQNPIDLILPVVAVEVKTYLDATMFGEIKSSSKSIRSASPNSKTFVLIGYRNLADEHIIAARQDSTITEIFSLRENEHSPILESVIKEYWSEIKKSVEAATTESLVPPSGKLLNP